MIRTLITAVLFSFASIANAALIIDLEDETNGGGFFGQITIENIVGGVNVVADIADPINAGLSKGDILELGFDIYNDSLLAGMSITNFSAINGTRDYISADLSAVCFDANNCNVYNGGVSGKSLDIGLAFGAKGRDEGFIQTLSFDFLAAGLTEDEFGELAVMRVQSIKGVDLYTAGSSKLAGSAPVSVPEPGMLSLLGGGLIGLSFMRRKIKK